MPKDAPAVPLLERLGLQRPELRAWAMYDWANSAFYTTIVAAVFPYYYNEVACADLAEGEATARLLWTNSIAAIVVALTAPFLGAAADYLGVKKKLLGAAALLGIVSTALMYSIGNGDWVLASALLIAGNVGVASSVVCYDSFLPHIARRGELDRVSSAGYAVGYLGGGTLLALQAVCIANPGWFGEAEDGTLRFRLAFVSVAVWWAVFSIPLFLRVPEPPRALEEDEEAGMSVARVAVTRVVETFRELRSYRQAFVLLGALLLYGEGIGTVYKIAASYAADLGIPDTTVLGALLITQFIGIPCAFGFGALATRIGARRAIYSALAVYVGVSCYAYFLRDGVGFTVLAVLVGMVQGGAQALGRSLFTSLIPAHKAGEFFGFYSLGSKFAGIFGPMFVGMVSVAAGDVRIGFVSIALFFIAGGLLLSRVDLDAGRRAAQEADAALHEPDGG